MSGVSTRAQQARTQEITRTSQLSSHDVSAMRLALALGRRGLGQCWPNPCVGAVIADSRTGRIIAGAWTARGGRPHAEAIALSAAGEAARGATAYTTLEPCSHWGKTPPCADALLRSGIARLVYGVVDPDPRVGGKGLERLAAHGVEVVAGPLPREAAWLAMGHTLRVSAKRPFIQLKIAVDAGGQVPAGNGAPRWVTGPEARAHGHLLRAETDAIMVGSGTVAADDPELTCRLPGLAARSPVRVVMSSGGTLPAGARMLRSAAAHPVWVVCAQGRVIADRAELERLGVVFIPVAADADGRPEIGAAVRALAERGVTRLLVEGGPRLTAAVLAAGLADEALVYRGAVPASGETIRPFGAAGLDALYGHPSLTPHTERPMGRDRLFIYRRAEFC
jgi:diaminohydroxyphosphoribosylaminopyrimidine deaminase/5-amino-6-(5-phosphoribosylamino)uracil reductase